MGEVTAARNNSDRSASALWQRMRVMAATGHELADELTAKADALEQAAAGFYASEQTHSAKQLIGAWARARSVWCAATGEPLV